MPNELSVIETTVLTNEEKTELEKSLERIIAEHKENRQEINRLVFESVAAMTEADDAESELSNKGFFQRLIGGITGSNQKLQNTINRNRAVAQYASQQTLQKLAEQNLMSFDLITAVNNKLNASINSVNDEFKNIYSGLSKFLKYNRNELARIESRLAKVEQNVNLLTWQNSIEYQEFDGEEYIDMDNTKKIVCLVRDFYDITKGNWSTSDLLLLKTAMSTIGIQPKEPINYYSMLREISHNQHLWTKLLGNVDIVPIDDPSHLISMGALEKLNALEHRESYIVDTIIDYIGSTEGGPSRYNICDQLTKNYLRKKANVNVDIDVESYDLILDLLYNIKQAEAEKLLLLSTGEQDNIIKEAEHLFLHGKMEEATEMFQILAESGNAKAMFFLGELFCWGLPADKLNRKTADMWRKKGAELNDALCILNAAYNLDVNDDEREKIITAILPDITELANSGNMYAQEELASISIKKGDETSALRWYNLASENGYFSTFVALGNFYYNKGEYSEAHKWFKMAFDTGFKKSANNIGNVFYSENNYSESIKWYQLAGEAGNDWGWHNLGCIYRDGLGVSEDKDKAIELYRKSYEMKGSASGESANCIGNIYFNKEEYQDANKWYQLAGENGNDWGWHNLGNDYTNGKGISKNEDKAIEFYKKSYEMKGESSGQSANNIGLFYYNKEDYSKANEWFNLAGEANCDWGWNNLANDYLWGQGFPENPEKAIHYYKKACELKGEATSSAAFQIASILEDRGDYKEAKQWYKIAADAGNNNAQKALDYL